MHAEAPDGWQLLRLDECVERIISGATPKAGAARYYEAGTIPFARIEDVVAASGGRLHKTELAITEDAVRETAVKVYPAGTPLLTMYGTIGAVAVTTRAMAANQAIAAFVGPQIDAGFLIQLLRQEASRLARLAGQTTQANISGHILKRHVVLVPKERGEQRRIANMLDAMDEAIEDTESVITATEGLRKALVQELFTRGVPGWHTQWKTVQGIGTIPGCWEVVPLGKVLEATQYGTNTELVDEPGGIPVLRMGNLQGGSIDWGSIKYSADGTNDLSNLMLEEGDILFNRTNSIDLVGKVSIVGTLPFRASFASYLVRLKVAAELGDPHWLNSYLNTVDTQDRIRRMATKGASQANINPTNLKKLVIPKPELAEQQAMSRAIRGMEDRIQREGEVAERLRATKDILAEALLSGRVSVPMESEVCP